MTLSPAHTRAMHLYRIAQPGQRRAALKRLQQTVADELRKEKRDGKPA